MKDRPYAGVILIEAQMQGRFRRRTREKRTPQRLDEHVGDLQIPFIEAAPRDCDAFGVNPD